MKTIIKKDPILDEIEKYPCLKITEDEVLVLFSSKSTGVVVHDPREFYNPGDFRSDWADSLFYNFNGKIILSN